MKFKETAFPLSPVDAAMQRPLTAHTESSSMNRSPPLPLQCEGFSMSFSGGGKSTLSTPSPSGGFCFILAKPVQANCRWCFTAQAGNIEPKPAPCTSSTVAMGVQCAEPGAVLGSMLLWCTAGCWALVFRWQRGNAAAVGRAGSPGTARNGPLTGQSDLWRLSELEESSWETEGRGWRQFWGVVFV